MYGQLAFACVVQFLLGSIFTSGSVASLVHEKFGRNFQVQPLLQLCAYALPVAFLRLRALPSLRAEIFAGAVLLSLGGHATAAAALDQGNLEIFTFLYCVVGGLGSGLLAMSAGRVALACGEGRGRFRAIFISTLPLAFYGLGGFFFCELHAHLVAVWELSKVLLLAGFVKFLVLVPAAELLLPRGVKLSPIPHLPRLQINVHGIFFVVLSAHMSVYFGPATRIIGRANLANVGLVFNGLGRFVVCSFADFFSPSLAVPTAAAVAASSLGSLMVAEAGNSWKFLLVCAAVGSCVGLTSRAGGAAGLVVYGFAYFVAAVWTVPLLLRNFEVTVVGHGLSALLFATGAASWSVTRDVRNK